VKGGDDAAVGAALDGDSTLVEATDAAGTPVLLLAARAGSKQVTLSLLGRGAAVGASCPRTGDSALHVAAAKDDLAVVRALLKFDADVNRVNDAGLTPLHSAASRGAAAVVGHLVKVGASRDVRAVDGLRAADLVCASVAAPASARDRIASCLQNGVDPDDGGGNARASRRSRRKV
jgi:ankyrin repeat protein